MPGGVTAADGSYTLSLVGGEHWINVYSDIDAYDYTGAIVLLIYRNRRSIALDELSEMKG